MSEEGAAPSLGATEEASKQNDVPGMPVTEGDKPLSKSQLKKLAKGKGVSWTMCILVHWNFVGYMVTM